VAVLYRLGRIIYRSTITEGVEGILLVDLLTLPIFLFLVVGMRAYLEGALSIFLIRDHAHALASERTAAIATASLPKSTSE